MLDDIDFEILTNKIHVYKNLLNDYNELVAILKNSELNPEASFFFKDWQPWSKFGTYVFDLGKDDQMKEEDISKNIDLYNREKYFVNKVNANFNIATDHYLSYYNIKKDKDWQKMGPSFAKYTCDNLFFEKNENAMVYHTDYQKGKKNEEKNFAITCTMYLNDDYEGGDLLFKIKDKIIPYKPKSGDVMVFPSGHPNILSEDCQYEHAVTKVSKKDKHFIRCFYMI